MQRLLFFRIWIFSAVVAFSSWGCGGRSARQGDVDGAAPSLPDAADAGLPPRDAGVESSPNRSDAARDDAGRDAERDGATSGATLTVIPDSLVSQAGDAVEFGAVVQQDDGSIQEVTKTGTWTSTNETVALSLNAGKYFALSPGKVSVTIVSGNLTGSATLEVTGDPLRGLEITPRLDVIEVGAQYTLNASLVTAQGARRPVDSYVEWSSSAAGVVRIDRDKLVAVSAGMGVISAKLGTFVATMPVVVSAATLDSITVEPPSSVIQFPGTQKLTASGHYSDGSTRDVTRLASWGTEDFKEQVSVSQDGLVIAQALGTVLVYAALNNVTGTATVTVGPGSPSGLNLLDSRISLPRYAADSPLVFATYNDGSTLHVSEVATWSTDDPSIVTVEPYNGLTWLNAVGIGSTRVHASFLGLTANADFVATNILLLSLEVFPDDATIFLSEPATPLSAFVSFADGSTHGIGGFAEWTVADATILTVSNAAGERGFARPKRLGTTRVTASRGGITGAGLVTVVP